MKKTKRIVAFALAAVLALLVLAGCKSTLTSIAHKLTGSSDEVQEEDTTQWAVLSSDPLMIDGITDTSAKYATAIANGSLNIVFNGVWSRQTDYFTAPNGMISVYGCGTAEGVQKFKISLWKRSMAAQSMWTTPPSTSSPTARTTTATSATSTPMPATG